MTLLYRVIQTHLPHLAETVGLYLLVKADVRSCEHLSTSANPDCGVLDQGQGALDCWAQSKWLVSVTADGQLTDDK